MNFKELNQAIKENKHIKVKTDKEYVKTIKSAMNYFQNSNYSIVIVDNFTLSNKKCYKSKGGVVAYHSAIIEAYYVDEPKGRYKKMDWEKGNEECLYSCLNMQYNLKGSVKYNKNHIEWLLDNGFEMEEKDNSHSDYFWVDDFNLVYTAHLEDGESIEDVVDTDFQELKNTINSRRGYDMNRNPVKNKGEKMKEVAKVGNIKLIQGLMDRILVKNELKFSAKGIAVPLNDEYKVYENSKITNLKEDMTLDKVDIFVKIPSQIDNLKVADLILQNEEYYFIRKVEKDEIQAINIATGKVEVLLPTVDIFGNSVYTKIFSAIEFLGGYKKLKKTNRGLLTLITSLYKNKDDLDTYIKEEGLETVTPLLVKYGSNLKKNKFISKYKQELMIVGAISGLVITNIDLANVNRKKVSKKQLGYIVAIIGLGAGFYYAKKRGLLDKFKDYLIKKNIKSKFNSFVDKIKGKFDE